MSTIDLERLIVRQRYFMPIEKSKLRDSILKELQALQPQIPKLVSWYTAEEHKHCFTFEVSYTFHFVYSETLGKKREAELIEQKVKEYNDGMPQSFFNELSRSLGDNPDSVHIYVVKAEKEGCTIDVECFSTLYRQLRQLPSKRKNVTDFDLQNAYLMTKRFLKDIFEGGLSATLIAEEKKKISGEITTFLINDVSIRQISDKIDALLDEATGEILIIGWLGTVLLKKLRELREKGVEIKVITGNVRTIREDPMRKEKERAMKELIGIIAKKNISIKPEFHGRAIVVDNKALVGSMDLDSYSLTGTRIEFATYTEDPETVRSLRNFFNQIFTPWKEEEEQKS
jgi:hypothetical protein